MSVLGDMVDDRQRLEQAWAQACKTAVSQGLDPDRVVAVAAEAVGVPLRIADTGDPVVRTDSAQVRRAVAKALAVDKANVSVLIRDSGRQALLGPNVIEIEVTG